MLSTPHRIAVIGASNSGKSTCVQTLTRIDMPDWLRDLASPNSNTQRPDTLDYGEMLLGDGTMVQVFGLPEQRHVFSLFDDVRESFLGIVLMVDASSPSGIDDVERILRDHGDLLRSTSCVAALNKGNDPAQLPRQQVREKLLEHGITAPVMAVDARWQEDMLGVVKMLFLRVFSDSVGSSVTAKAHSLH
jgi:signal recognition particle receptor subunit beta